MPSHVDPADLTPEKRLGELGAIFAKGVLTLRHNPLRGCGAKSGLAGKVLRSVPILVRAGLNEHDVAAIRRLAVVELRQKYAEVFGEETRSRHKQHLARQESRSPVLVC